MNTLITINDIKAVESFSSNTDYSLKLKPHILDAQEFDVMPLLGESFWLDIELNVGSYTDLLNETVYTWQGKRYRNPGLKAVIIGFTLSRYKLAVNVSDTPFGLVQKETPYSSPTDGKLIAKQAALKKSGAEAQWLRVKEYLNRHASQYPKWVCTWQKRTVGGIRITKVEKP